LADRPVLKSPEGLLNAAEQRLDDAVERLQRAGNHLVDGQTQRLAQLAGKLHTLSPLQILGRGYAAVRKDGEWLSDGGDLQPGDGVTVRFCDGEADCTVTQVRSMEE
ncbi:MAG: exodeoxyribonuclease VII large subunit, partial [Clostridia bacterium]|nr:exodeoxyribonuclease VII large subunit [Clostridia bacterium]